ncbi:hypothetical protein EHQ68_04570 [Leptospira congkakensis]|uniref:Uncharacterized protein n=1 Tax=Leptospira congkakensis TaxID=2484932 RepID=A0A4Z1ADP9_9LEPT|nr:hypothetical protein [Leptospira congkakensis]TGL90704.1 hypothetical protein EHQ69_12330 [Leptospira congkakensis]TGL91711.1 hypothetical protein EHQ68_04570 [Leptospira congkakensis]TGL98763.1 hypothetical protein EHQ70_04155 [Leptospira congkakensis]
MKNRSFILFISFIFSLNCDPKQNQGDPKENLKLCILTAIELENNPPKQDDLSIKQVSAAAYLALCYHDYKR